MTNGQRCCNVCSITIPWNSPRGLCSEHDLINYDRTWKVMVCLNPRHDIVKFKTNQIGNVYCPTCKATMVREIKPMIEELSLDDLIDE